MNYALIFAGGAGRRMNTKALPKQFLELHGKPIIIYTLEHFERHPQIDGIVISCIDGWESYLRDRIVKYGIKKVIAIVKGGETGQLSIRNAAYRLGELAEGDAIVLIHDGVRPVIDEGLISDCIDAVKEYGSAVAASRGIETVMLSDGEGFASGIQNRSMCMMAKAPQCFYLNDLIKAHKKAENECKTDYIDTASLMMNYGHRLRIIDCLESNIKITTPTDYYLFRALMDAMDSHQAVDLQEE